MKIQRLWALLLTASVSTLLASSALASDPSNVRLEGLKTSEERPLVFSVDSRYESDYVSDNGVPYGDPVSRTDLAVDLPYQFRVGGSIIRGIGADDPYSDEEKLFIEKAFLFCDDWDLILGYRHEFLAQSKWNIRAPYMELGKNFQFNSDVRIRAYARVEHWSAEATDDNGFLPELGLRLLAQLSPRFSLDLRLSAINDPGIQGGNGGIVGVAEGYLNFDVDQGGLTQIYTGGKLFNPWTDGPTDVRERRGVYEVGVRVKDIGEAGRKAVNFFKGETGN